MGTGIPLISIVVPFKNEEQALPLLAADLRACFDGLEGKTFEVILVDDGSTDRSAAVAKNIAAADGRFRVLRLSRNFGKEAAVTAGVAAARGDAVIPLDADGQHPVELIPRFIELWQAGNAVVVGRRTDRSDDGFTRRALKRAFYALFNRLSEVPLRADVGDFRLMDRAVVDAFLAMPEHQRFLKGLFAYAGFDVVEVPFTPAHRLAGETKFSKRALLHFAADGLFAFSTAPLRALTYIGTAVAGGTIVYAMLIAWQTVVQGIDVPGYASLFVAVLFMGGINLIGIGIIGEYLGRVYTETKRRPLYFVAEEFPPRT